MKKLLFWLRYSLIMLLFAVASLLSIILFPVAYFFRYKLKLDLFWIFLNDETDFGEQWWKDREGITKDTFFTAWKWNIRNSAWNLKKSLQPKWGTGFQIYEVVKNTLTNPEHQLDWANRDEGLYGTNHVYYFVQGTLYGRFSHASPKFELQMGAAGNRYKFRMKIGRA